MSEEQPHEAEGLVLKEIEFISNFRTNNVFIGKLKGGNKDELASSSCLILCTDVRSIVQAAFVCTNKKGNAMCEVRQLTLSDTDVASPMSLFCSDLDESCMYWSSVQDGNLIIHHLPALFAADLLQKDASVSLNQV